MCVCRVVVLRAGGKGVMVNGMTCLLQKPYSKAL